MWRIIALALHVAVGHNNNICCFCKNNIFNNMVPSACTTFTSWGLFISINMISKVKNVNFNFTVFFQLSDFAERFVTFFKVMVSPRSRTVKIEVNNRYLSARQSFISYAGFYYGSTVISSINRSPRTCFGLFRFDLHC